MKITIIAIHCFYDQDGDKTLKTKLFEVSGDPSALDAILGDHGESFIVTSEGTDMRNLIGELITDSANIQCAPVERIEVFPGGDYAILKFNHICGD